MSDRIIQLWIISFLISVSIVQAAEKKVTIEDNIVARVNGRPIYTHQLMPRTQAALAKRAKYGAVSDKTRHLLERTELEKLIDFELLTQAGEKFCANSRSDNGSHIALQQSSTGLQEKGKPGACIDKYLKQQGLEEVSVSDAEVRRYYEQNKLSFKQGDKGETFQGLDEAKGLIKRLLIRNARERKIAEITQTLRGVASLEIKLK